jgi:hypothetical protein
LKTKEGGDDMHQEESSAAAGQEPTAADDRQKGLQILVGELLKANQELRFKVAQLEQRVERSDRTNDGVAAVYGMLLL